MSDAMPANPRFAPMPLPVVLHIVSAILFAILGPLQFVAGFRRRWPAWHRLAGRLLVGCGLLVGLTGLWMTVFYAPPDNSGPLLYASRLVFGAATQMLTLMVGEIVAGHPTALTHDLLMGAGWVINLAVAEWIVRRRPARPTRTATQRLSSASFSGRHP